MINDLRVADTLTWKYVDDTTIAEIVPRNEQGNAQVAVDAVECHLTWSYGEKSSCLVETNITVLRLIIGENDPVVFIFTWLFLL